MQTFPWVAHALMSQLIIEFSSSFQWQSRSVCVSNYCSTTPLFFSEDDKDQRALEQPCQTLKNLEDQCVVPLALPRSSQSARDSSSRAYTIRIPLKRPFAATSTLYFMQNYMTCRLAAAASTIGGITSSSNSRMVITSSPSVHTSCTDDRSKPSRQDHSQHTLA